MRRCLGCSCRIGHTEGCAVAAARWGGTEVPAWVPKAALAAFVVVFICSVLVLIGRP